MHNSLEARKSDKYEDMQTLLVLYVHIILISYPIITQHGEINQQSVKYISSAKQCNFIAIHIARYGEFVRICYRSAVDCRVKISQSLPSKQVRVKERDIFEKVFI